MTYNNATDPGKLLEFMENYCPSMVLLLSLLLLSFLIEDDDDMVVASSACACITVPTGPANMGEECVEVFLQKF